MSVLKQFNLTRTSLLTFIKDLDKDMLDRDTKYFDNTIRWYVGNTLLMHEKLLFVSKNSYKLPEQYRDLFSSDVSAKDWYVEAPTLEELMEQLEDQQNRINNFDELFWKSDVKFKVPYGHVETHGDLLIMLAYREAELLGTIKTMKQFYDKY
ncbi:DinB family protein [Ornithinibacillus halotolerans]|uniref:Formate dehydrogenase n=1 Tax=Ornithinibacillus halotolerans TaxID=1274357 RepID=A0A916WAV6_9BACI|nr:DinB family protein [Ornithinibacillus halotolerans]GGA81172.1 formate dehydrogenase [Ornithinibacillus halotolerans]